MTTPKSPEEVAREVFSKHDSSFEVGDYMAASPKVIDIFTKRIAELLRTQASQYEERIKAIDKLINYVKINSKDKNLLNLVREYEKAD